MNRKPVSLKLDSHSDLMIISKKKKLEKIGAPKMEKNYREACGASSSKRKIEGVIATSPFGAKLVN